MTAPPTGNAYDKYGTSNPVERRVMQQFLACLDATLPSATPRRVLEVGTGEGEILGRLRARWPDAALTALDLPEPRLAAHWRDRGLTGLFGSADALPFPDASADLVVAVEVLEHVPDPDAALAEIARVAAGDVVLSVPREPLWRLLNLARGRYVGAFGNTPGHVQHWSTAAFTRLVARHLDVVEVRRPLPWTVVRARR